MLLLACSSRVTEGARKVVLKSSRAMGIVVVVQGEVRQFMWNEVAGRVLGMELGVKTVFSKNDEDEEISSRIKLTWNGKIIKERKNIPGEL